MTEPAATPGAGAPALSVVMACRNAESTIGAQLDALAAQRWSEPWELLVVDNGSSDGTRALVEGYRERIPGLVLLEAPEKPSQPYALNRGVAAARGELLAFCDADDVVSEGWIEAMGTALRRDGFVASRLELEELNPPWVLQARGRQQDEGLQDGRYPPFLPHAASAGLGIRRALHVDVGGFDESSNYLFDTDYCYTVQLAGTPLRFAPDAVVHYRYRRPLRGIYRQAQTYALSDARLQAKYGRAAEISPLRWALTYWRVIARSLPGMATRGGRARVAWLLGWQVGRIRGSVAHRVLAA